MLERLKDVTTGAAILRDWLGDGLRPVPAEQSEARAKVCASCPHNTEDNWWTTATSVVAQCIRKQMEIKGEVGAKTSLDEKLGTCDICLCHLPLKVHCPMEHILKHTFEDKLKQLPDFCWQRKETNV